MFQHFYMCTVWPLSRQKNTEIHIKEAYLRENACMQNIATQHTLAATPVRSSNLIVAEFWPTIPEIIKRVDFKDSIHQIFSV